MTKINSYLLAIVGCQHGERRHGVNWQWFGKGSCKRLGEERNSSLRFAARREELALDPFIALRNKEGWCPQTTATILTSVHLVIQELLYVVDGQKMLSIH